MSYYYGDSNIFSLENVYIMKKFYLYFPVYNEFIEKIDWEYYKLLLRLEKDECYFYYRIVIFCNSDISELYNMINNNIFFRI